MTDRQIPFDGRRLIGIRAGNRSTAHAGAWLDLLAGEGAADVDAPIAIVAGDAPPPPDAECVIRLWDFQVGIAGDGRDASAVSGAAAVIGSPAGPGQPLPAEMPEKWCGAFGLLLALAEVWRRLGAGRARAEYDVSAADILRSFSLQNAGDAAEMRRRWRRNGPLCIEHGGIFPMGFFRCRDGHVAVLGRSRRDWRQIRQAIGDPPWARAPEYENPFAIALDSAEADRLLERTLADFDRDELLRRGLESEAVLAPVFSQDEAAAHGVFRDGFVGPNRRPAMPFVAQPLAEGAANAPATSDDPLQPLAGLRCLELAWVWSGPMVGQLLADLGAEVIKLESDARFDLYRTRGLETMRGKMDEALRLESSVYFQSLNRNKLGLTLDLKSEDGLETAKRAIAASDVLVENFTVGTMARMGLGPDVLAAANPALAHLAMSGPGKGSAVEKLRSYGLVLSALGGAEALIQEDGAFVGSPTFSLSDPNAAIFGALAAIAAAIAARETGQGRAIDLSQIEAAATLAGSPESGQASPHAGAPVRELWETDDAPEFQDVSGWIDAHHPTTGAGKLVAASWRIGGARPPVRMAAPRLGDGEAALKQMSRT